MWRKWIGIVFFTISFEKTINCTVPKHHEMTKIVQADFDSHAYIGSAYYVRNVPHSEHSVRFSIVAVIEQKCNPNIVKIDKWHSWNFAMLSVLHLFQFVSTHQRSNRRNNFLFNRGRCCMHILTANIKFLLCHLSLSKISSFYLIDCVAVVVFSSCCRNSCSYSGERSNNRMKK